MRIVGVLLFVLVTVLATALPANADDTKQAVRRSGATPATASADSAGQGADRPVLQHRNPRYRLTRSDVLNLDFPLTPEFSQTVVIQPDGFITLRSVGGVRVEGLTLPEATETIRAAYSTVLHNPIITIDLKDFEKPYFIAGGQVGHPGKYDLRGDTTLVQAVQVAGGFTEDSKHSEVWLFRRVSDEWVEVHKFNVKKMLGNGDLQEDAHLHPGDMVYVPKNGISKVRRYLPVATMGSYFSPAP